MVKWSTQLEHAFMLEIIFQQPGGLKIDYKALIKAMDKHMPDGQENDLTVKAAQMRWQVLKSRLESSGGGGGAAEGGSSSTPQTTPRKRTRKPKVVARDDSKDDIEEDLEGSPAKKTKSPTKKGREMDDFVVSDGEEE